MKAAKTEMKKAKKEMNNKAKQKKRRGGQGWLVAPAGILVMGAGLYLGLYGPDTKPAELAAQKVVMRLTNNAPAETQTVVTETVKETEAMAEVELTPLQSLELKYVGGTLEETEYLELAWLLGQEQRVYEQREVLETCYMLYDNTAAFDSLQDITVNLEEEEPQVLELVDEALGALTDENAETDGIEKLLEADFTKALMPMLKDGKRSFYYEFDGREAVITIEAADDVYTKRIWITDGDNLTSYELTGKNIRKLSAATTDGALNGEFESVTIDGSFGDVSVENGTYANGIITGEYTAKVCYGSGKAEPAQLWKSMDELKYTLFTGKFDEEGKTLLEQPDLKKIDVKVNEGEYLTVYAYDSKKSGYLFMGSQVEKPSFGADTFGWSKAPEVEKYEPVTTAESRAEAKAAIETQNQLATIDASDLQVRVYAGTVQYFDGQLWHSLGTVGELAETDPIAAYTGNIYKEVSANQLEVLNTDGTTLTDDEGQALPSAVAKSGSIAAASKTPTSTGKKPSASAASSAAQQAVNAAAQQAAQQAASEPAPQQPSPSPAPSPAPTPTPAPEPAPEPEPQAPTTGNDTDYGWSADIL